MVFKIQVWLSPRGGFCLVSSKSLRQLSGFQDSSAIFSPQIVVALLSQVFLHCQCFQLAFGQVSLDDCILFSFIPKVLVLSIVYLSLVSFYGCFSVLFSVPSVIIVLEVSALFSLSMKKSCFIFKKKMRIYQFLFNLSQLENILCAPLVWL